LKRRLIDSKMRIFLDGRFSGEGWWRKGFDHRIKTTVGKHVLKFEGATLETQLDFSSGGRYEARFHFVWGVQNQLGIDISRVY
jgi:hypothetical protein